MPQSYLDIQNSALGNDFDPNVYRPLAKQSILDALGEIARKVQMPANEDTASVVTVAGTASYLLPATNIRVLTVFDAADGAELESVTQEAVDANPSQAARPSGYALYAGNIVLWPTPQTVRTLTLRFLGATGLPSLDTDIMQAATGVPEDYLHGLVEYARWRLFRQEDDFEAARFWQGEWQATLLSLKADVQRRDRSRKRQVPGMFAGGGPTPSFRLP